MAASTHSAKSRDTLTLPQYTPFEEATIDEVCKMLHSKHPALVEANLKTTPAWYKVIGYIAYLLENDGKISRGRISQVLRCKIDLINEQIRVMRNNIASSDGETTRRLGTLRASIRERNGQSAEALLAALSEEIAPQEEATSKDLTSDAVLTAVSNASGLSLDAIKGTSPASIAVAARDVVFFFLANFLKMLPAESSAVLRRNPFDVKMALHRMRDLDMYRRQYLVDAAKELGVNIDEALRLADCG